MSAGPGNYTLWRMDGSGSTSPSVTEQAAFLPSYGFPARAPQPGTSDTLDTLDGRIQSPPVWDGSRVWFANVVGLFNGPPTIVQYGFITPASNSMQLATVRHDSASADFNPAIGVGLNPNGTETIFLNWVFTDTAVNLPATDTAATNVLSSTGCTAASQGLVLSTDPPAQSVVSIGSEVTLTVCNLLVRVPSLTGQDEGTAESRIRGAGLTVGTVSSNTRCIEPQGTVVSQSPGSGSLVMRGSAVNISVSTGTDSHGKPCVFQ